MFDFFVVSIPEQYWYQKVHFKLIQILKKNFFTLGFKQDLVDYLVV